MSKLFSVYNSWLQKLPLTTKSTTGGFLFWLGDAATQIGFEKKQYAWKRGIDFFIAGFVYFAPALHFWYCKGLPKISNALFSNLSKNARVFGEVLVDQLAFAPVILTGFFYVNPTIINRKLPTFQEFSKIWNEKIWETLKANWTIWPIASTVNFYFMPMEYRVLFANVVGLFWNMILSYIASK